MARRNGIWYEGRVINKNGQSKVSRARSGRRVLSLLVAEDFRDKNRNAPDDKKDPTKGPDEYVTVATAWHQIQVFDTEEGHPDFEKLITDPKFNHGAVVVVDASYQEDSRPWVDKQNITRVGRRESIFIGKDDGGGVGFKVLDDGRTFTASQGFEKPLWDGVSDLPSMGGGGGATSAPEYRDDEGF